MGWRWLRRTGAAVVTVVALAVIVALATGTVSLVTTHGISMEPRFHSGDLAVVVAAGGYHVGQIVAYRSPLLRIVVLHRIVAEHGGRFTFKGDNNSFLDPLRLPPSTVEGRLWLRIPKGGLVLGWFRSPLVLGALAVLVVLVAAGGATRRRRAPGRSLGPVPSGRDRRHAAPGTGAPGWWPLAVPLVAVAACVAATVAAWSTPTTRAGARPVPYEQRLSFTYSASAASGATYPTGSVTTGMPVFLHLVHVLHVRAAWSLEAPPGAANSVSGTIGATARLEGPAGWSGLLASAAPVAFTGTTAHVELPLVLSRIGTLGAAFSRETDMPLEDTQVVITPVVHVAATVAGAPVSTSFAPSLDVQLDAEALVVPTTAVGQAPAAAPSLTPVQAGSVERPDRVPARITVAGRTVGVGSARRIAPLAAAASLLAVAVTAWAIRRRRRMDETTRIRATHGEDLVPVSSSPARTATHVVDVATFAALARLARRYDCVILELEHAGGCAYFVECGATLYRHGPDPADGLTVVGTEDDEPWPTAELAVVPPVVPRPDRTASAGRSR